MALTHGTATRTAIADAVVDRIDLGSGTATGKLKIYDSSNNLLVTLSMSNPAFGAAAAGVATASTITDGTATGSGTADNFTIVDRDGTVIISGAISADLTIASTTITIGDTVSCSSMTYTAAA